MDPATRRQVGGLALAGSALLLASLVFSSEAIFERAAGLADDPAVFTAVLVAVALCRPLVAWPVAPLAALVGYVFGVAGLPLALAAIVLTTLPPYVLARTIRPTAGPLGRAGATGADLFATAGDTRGVLAARLAPVPTDVVSYGAGLAAVPVRSFLLGTILGEVPWAAAFVVAGSSMDRLTTEGLSAGLPLSLLVGGVAVAALLLVGPLYGRLVDRPTAE